MNKTLIITDMDGTLNIMKHPSNKFNVPLTPELFSTRTPIKRVIDYIQELYFTYNNPSLLCDNNVAELHVCSLSPDALCDDAKTKWLDKHVKIIPATINLTRNKQEKIESICKIVTEKVIKLNTNDQLMVEIIDDDADILSKVNWILDRYPWSNMENVVIIYRHISQFID